MSYNLDNDLEIEKLKQRIVQLENEIEILKAPNKKLCNNYKYCPMLYKNKNACSNDNWLSCYNT